MAIAAVGGLSHRTGYAEVERALVAIICVEADYLRIGSPKIRIELTTLRRSDRLGG